MTWPDGFLWGTAASSTQAEGAAPASDWALLESHGLVPSSGSGNDFATRYKEDFAALVSHGLLHHRMSLEWARIEPRQGRRDTEEIERYRQLLVDVTDMGIQPWLCLHHFTLPGWFTVDEGGFRRDPRRARYLWNAHVDFVAETFGDLAAGWQPVNEPVAYVTRYLAAGLTPEQSTPDKIDALCATVHQAAADAARAVRGAGAPVATIQALSPLLPADDSAEAAAAVARAEQTTWHSWNRPELLEPFDLLGFSYYSAARIDANGERLPHPPGSRVGPMGYAPWPEGLAEVISRLSEDQPLPLLVAELGIGTDDEAWQSEYMAESLEVLSQTIDAGADVRGCFFWTSVDNYEWLHGFDVPFGLFDGARRGRPVLEEIARIR